MAETRYCAWFGTEITEPVAIHIQPVAIKMNPNYQAPTINLDADKRADFFKELWFCKDGWIEFQRHYGKIKQQTEDGIKTVVDRDRLAKKVEV